MEQHYEFEFIAGHNSYHMMLEPVAALDLWPNDTVVLNHKLEKVQTVEKCNTPNTGNQNMVCVTFYGGTVRYYQTDVNAFRASLSRSV